MIGIGFLVAGIVLMLVQRLASLEFFRRRAETAADHLLEAAHAPSAG